MNLVAQYLALVHDRDQHERYSHLAIILADTYELTKQVIVYRAHFDSSSETGSNPLIVNELRDKNHSLEKGL